MTPRQKATQHADRWFSLWIRTRYPVCATCGNPTQDCGHYVSRAVLITRWDSRNAVGQCRICNGQHEIDPEPLRKAMIEIHGEEAINEIEHLRFSTKKMSSQEIREIGDYYKGLVQAMEDISEFENPPIEEVIEGIIKDFSKPN